MSDFTIHTVPGSPYARAVLLTLEEKGETWDLVPLTPGAHRGPGHLARQPFGRMPAFDHAGFQIYETQAILRYLDRVLPAPPLTPSDARCEARMNQIIGITDWYFMPQVGAPIVFPRLVGPRLGIPVSDAGIAAALPAAVHCVGEIARLLGDHPFMAGDALSLADLMIAPHLSMLAETPEGQDMLAAHQHLTAWLGRIEDRASMRNTTWDALDARVNAPLARAV